MGLQPSYSQACAMWQQMHLEALQHREVCHSPRIHILLAVKAVDSCPLIVPIGCGREDLSL